MTLAATGVRWSRLVAGAAVIGAGCGVVVMTFTASAASAAALSGNVDPAVAAPPAGKVGVVASSAAQGGKVAVVVANGSAAPAGRVVVTGLATRADGGSVTHTATRVTVPAVIEPGGIALAGLNFGKHGVPRGATITFRVTSRRAATSSDPALLEVRDLVLSAPIEGSVAQTLDAQVFNTGASTLRGPVRMTATCFNEARLPVTTTTEVVEVRRIAPGKSVRATVPFATLCPAYLVGARAVG